MDNGPADALSRMRKDFRSEQNVSQDKYTYLYYVCDGSEVMNREDIRYETKNDAILSQVESFVKSGWAEKVSAELQPFKNKQL